MEQKKDDLLKLIKIKYICKSGYKLTEEEINLLLAAYQSGDQDAGEVLVNGMDRRIKFLIKKYASNLIGGVWSFSYIFNECKSAMASVYKSYSLEESRAKFSTYFARAVYNHICGLFKLKQKHEICLSLDEKVSDDDDSEIFADCISDGKDY